jgi:hypothetical protein
MRCENAGADGRLRPDSITLAGAAMRHDAGEPLGSSVGGDKLGAWAVVDLDFLERGLDLPRCLLSHGCQGHSGH